MQPFEDLSSAEMDPQNEDLLVFLHQVYDIPVGADPEPAQRELALAKVRQRLLESRREPAKQPVLRLLDGAETLDSQALFLQQRTNVTRKSGWKRSFALLAAALLVALIVGSLLTVFNLTK